jgi:hypothetical protein
MRLCAQALASGYLNVPRTHEVKQGFGYKNIGEAGWHIFEFIQFIIIENMQHRDRSPQRSVRSRPRWDIPGLFDHPEPWSIPKLCGKPYKDGGRNNRYRVGILGKKTSFSVRQYGSWEAALAAAEQFQYNENMLKGLGKNSYRKITPGVIEMQLTRGKTMIFDEQDLEFAKQYTWRAAPAGSCPWIMYARTGKKALAFHHHLFGQQADHLNGDGLDNRRVNLDPGTQAENNNNKRLHKNNVSGVNGVYYEEGTNRWRAQWSENGVRKYESFNVSEWGEHAEEKANQARQAADQLTGCRNGIRPKANQQ